MAIFPGALGDLLLALPALRALRSRASTLTVVVSEPLRALSRAIGLADAVESLDAAGAAWLFGADARPSWLDGRPVVHAWLGARDADVRARLARVASTVALHAVERGPGAVHAAVAYAAAVGLDVPHRRALAPLGHVDAPASALADDLLRALGRPPLVVHRGAGSPAKRWHPHGFAAIAAWWRASGGAVVDVAGPAERGEASLPGATTLREWALPDLAALLAGGRLFVGNDSGVSHLAGAVGTCGAVLFTATEPRRWRPLSHRLVALPAIDRTPATPARAIGLLRRLATLTSLGGDTIDRA